MLTIALLSNTLLTSPLLHTAIIVPSSQFHTSPWPLYDLFSSPPTASALVAATEPITSEIPQMGRKQPLSCALFSPRPNCYSGRLGTYVVIRHICVILLDEEDINDDGGTSVDDMNFHRQGCS